MIGVEQTATDLFLLLDGRRVARRGRPGTREARTWISVVPGWRIHDEWAGDVVTAILIDKGRGRERLVMPIA